MPETQTRTKKTAETKAKERRADALAAKLEAEAEKIRHEAREARAAADMAESLAEERRRDYEYMYADDGHHHIYKFTGPVNPVSVANCQAMLSRWSRMEPGCNIEIVFNSPGGSVIDGMALWDFLQHIRQSGHKITTVCRGYAASMGGILLQAGDVRVMGRESYLMIHEISAGAGGKIGEIKDDVKFYDRICERIVDIFVSRSGGKCTKAKFVKSWERIDWWIDSEEALKLGFVDEVR